MCARPLDLANLAVRPRDMDRDARMGAKGRWQMRILNPRDIPPSMLVRYADELQRMLEFLIDRGKYTPAVDAFQCDVRDVERQLAILKTAAKLLGLGEVQDD